MDVWIDGMYDSQVTQRYSPETSKRLKAALNSTVKRVLAQSHGSDGK